MEKKNSKPKKLQRFFSKRSPLTRLLSKPSISRTSSISSFNNENVLELFQSSKEKRDYEMDNIFLYFKDRQLEDEFILFLYTKKSYYIRFSIIVMLCFVTAMLLMDIFIKKERIFMILDDNMIAISIYYGARVLCIIVASIFFIFMNCPCVYNNKRFFESSLFWLILVCLMLLEICGALSNANLIITSFVVLTSFLRYRFVYSCWYFFSFLGYVLYSSVLLFSPYNSFKDSLIFFIQNSSMALISSAIIIFKIYYDQLLLRKIFINKKEMELSEKKIMDEYKREVGILKNIFPENLIEHLRGDDAYSDTKSVISAYSTTKHSSFDMNKVSSKVTSLKMAKDDSMNFMNMSLPKRKSTLHRKKFPFIQRYSMVSAIMCDIVGFTKFSNERSSRFIIGMLNRYYSKFDKIAKDKNLEKIKTIGDAYFCCALESPENGPKRAVLAALEMVTQFNFISNKMKIFLQCRIGVGCGGAFIVIMGDSNRFLSFDSFGPAIEEAVELEAKSHPNRVLVSKTVIHYVKDVFNYEKHDNKNVNGFFITGRKNIVMSNSVHDNDDIVDNDNWLIESNIGNSNSDIVNISGTYSGNDDDNDNDNDESDNGSEHDNNNSSNSSSSIEKKILRYKVNKITLGLKRWNDNVEYFKESYPDLKAYVKISYILSSLLHILSLIITILSRTNKNGDFWDNWYIPFIACEVIYFILSLLYAIIPLPYYFGIVFSYFSLLFNSIFGCGLMIIKLIQWSNGGVPEGDQNERIFINILQIISSFSQSLYPNIHAYVKVCSMMVYIIPTFLFQPFLQVSIVTLISSYCVNYSLCIISFFIGYYQYQYNSLKAFCDKKFIEEKKNQLEKERDQNVSLLRSSLPEPVIKTLMESQNFKNETVKEGSIIFLKISPFQVTSNNGVFVLRILNMLFNAFDKIVIEHINISKIKSHFSNYLIVSGVNMLEDENNPIMQKKSVLHVAKKILNVGLELLEKKNLKDKLSISIGCHTGNFSAGIVGTVKFLYDVFGSSINMAARLAETSEKNKIHVSEKFIEGLEKSMFNEGKSTFLKGKGNVNTFYVNYV